MSRFTPVFLLCMVILLLFVTVTGSHGLLHLQKLNNEVQIIEEKNRSLQSEILQFQGKIVDVNESDFALEKKAREELGLARPGEVVYVFPGMEQR